MISSPSNYADNVGDNVGDVAGMEQIYSFLCSYSLAAMVLVNYVIKILGGNYWLMPWSVLVSNFIMPMSIEGSGIIFFCN